MNSLLSLSLTLSLMPLTALASEPQGDTPVVSVSSGPRLRLGAGAWGGYGNIVAQFSLGAGVSAQFGLQLNDAFAVYLLAEGGGYKSLYVGHVSAVAEYQPTDWFAIASGVGFIGGNGMCLDLNPCTHEAYGVGVPLRMTFAFGPAVDAGSHRHRFYAALDGVVGHALAGNSLGKPDFLIGSLGLSLGYQLM
jgi:hypothetical protein